MSEDATIIRVLVVDDQTAVREALATVLDLQADFEVVGAAANGAEAVELAKTKSPNVVLMDLNMPIMGGVEATAQILETSPDIAVVILTTFADEQSIFSALSAGARGYLTKESGREDIARAIRAAAAGQAVMDPAVQQRLLAAAAGSAATINAPQPLPAELTPREIEVLTQIGKGLSNRAIAQHLYVSEATVKTHINNLFAKARLQDRAQAVDYAASHGLV